jgi:hypothetical protein
VKLTPTIKINGLEASRAGGFTARFRFTRARLGARLSICCILNECFGLFD